MSAGPAIGTPPGRSRARADFRAVATASGRIAWIGPDGRFASKAAIAEFAVRPGTRYRGPDGRLRTVAPMLEHGARPRRRARRDPLARELGAGQYTGPAGEGHGRTDLYVPEDATLAGTAAAIRSFVARGGPAGMPDPGGTALLLVRIVFPDGTAEWRSTSFTQPLEVALAEGAARLHDWSRGTAPSMQRMRLVGKTWRTDYMGARIASLEIVRGGRAEREEERRGTIKRQGKAIRRKEARDRGRGVRTSRGR